jgi:hypothetical protein
MSSNKGTKARILALAVGAAGLVGLAGDANAALLASGPLRILANEYYRCAAVNAGNTAVDVKVRLSIAGSYVGSGAQNDCTSLGTAEVCEAENQAGGSNYRSCTITTNGAKRAVRGTFCNTSTGVCIPVQ